MNEYFYVFKKLYLKTISEEYEKSDFKINYNNIRMYDDLYSSFIHVLFFVLDKYNDEVKQRNQIRYFLESNNLMDRLKGLKLSKKFIKLVML